MVNKRGREGRVQRRGVLRKIVFSVLRVACEAVFSTQTAYQTTAGTALCSCYRYGAYGAIYLSLSVQNFRRRVLTRFAARFFP